MDKFYELRNFMNAWSPQQEQQEQQELHESSVNRLYECKPVKIGTRPNCQFISSAPSDVLIFALSFFDEASKKFQKMALNFFRG